MGAFLAGLGAAAISAAPQLVNMASSLISSGRADYWHNRDQKHLDKRQDTEIQRRVADAQASGINPYDAIGAGSGASSSTIAHSGAGGLDLGEFNPGAHLDYKVAKEHVKQERARTAAEQFNAKVNFMDMLDRSEQFAFNHGYYADLFFDPKSGFKNREGVSGHYDYSADTPFNKSSNSALESITNSADMIKKQNQWFTTNQILDAINSGTGSIGNVAGAFSGGFGAYRNYEGGKYFRAQRNYFEPEFIYPKHEMGFHP